MPVDPSLFSIITSSHSNRLFRQTQEGLNIISAQIEGLLLRSALTPDVYLGVQTFSSFELYAARYEELALHCGRLVIFGEADTRPRPLPNTEYIGLPPGSALTRERFLTVNTSGWQVMLLAQLVAETAGRLERQRQYQTVMTFSAQVIEQCAMLAGMLAGRPSKPVGRAETISQQMYTAQLVMQLVQLADAPNLNLPQVLAELPALLDLAQSTVGTASVNTRLIGLVSQMRERLRADIVTIYRNETTMLRPVVSTYPLDQIKGLVVGQGAAGRATELPLGRYANGAEAGAELGYGACKATYALPIYTDGATAWGVIAFGAVRPDAFQEVERAPLAALAGLVAGIVRAGESVPALTPALQTATVQAGTQRASQPAAQPISQSIATPTNGSVPTNSAPTNGTVATNGTATSAAATNGAAPTTSRRIRLGGAATANSTASTNGGSASSALANIRLSEPTAAAAVVENPYEPYQRRLISHLVSFDRDAADRVWQEAYARFSARELCLNVLQPVQIAIGEGWHRGQVSVAAEHFSTQYCEGKLNGFLNSYPDNPDGATILTGCAQGETHQTGMVMMSLFLRWEGHRVIYLGGTVPNSTIADAVQEIKPDILCLSATMKENAYNLVETGHIMAKLSNPPIFCYGGPAFIWFPELREMVRGTYLGDDPPSALANVRKLTETRRAQALKVQS